MRARSACWLLCAVVVGGCLGSEAWGQQTISWQPNVEIAKRIAVQTNRLVLIHFWSPSCGPCQRMEAEVFVRPEVAAAFEAAYVPVKLNVDYFPSTATQFGITALPTDIVITPQGQVIGKNVGALTADKYTGMLRQVASNVRREAIPGHGELPVASIPGTAPSMGGAPAAPNYGNNYGMQVPGAEASRSAAAPVEPQYGTPPSASPGTSAYTNPAPPMMTASPGSSVGGQPSGAPSAMGSTNAAAQPGAGWISSDAGMSGSPGTGSEPGGPAAAQAPQSWQSASSQPQVGVQSPQVGERAATEAQTPQVHAGNPPLGLDGYCPVQLTEKERWEKGNARWGLIHRGRTYLFAGPEQQSRFFADPDRYAPVLSGNDAVLAVEKGQKVLGRREFGAWYEGHVYLFSSEDSLRRFDADPSRYAKPAVSQMTPPTQNGENGMAAGPGSGGLR